jgi:hypothetical protein
MALKNIDIQAHATNWMWTPDSRTIRCLEGGPDVTALCRQQRHAEYHELLHSQLVAVPRAVPTFISEVLDHYSEINRLSLAPNMRGMLMWRPPVPSK